MAKRKITELLILRTILVLWLAALVLVAAPKVFAQGTTIILPPGGVTTVGGVTVVCQGRRSPVCSLKRRGNDFEIWSDDSFVESFSHLQDALGAVDKMKKTGACQYFDTP